MPNIGDIAKAGDIQKNSKMHYIWEACVDCGKERWVAYPNGKVRAVRCLTCSLRLTAKTRKKDGYHRGVGNSNWKCGRIEAGKGYVALWLDETSPYFGMAQKNGYILEHRLVMAKSLSRCLINTEQVHHINGIKNDNRINNLQLVSPLEHHTFMKMCSHCELRKEIRLLRWQIKEQSEQIRNLTTKLMGV